MSNFKFFIIIVLSFACYGAKATEIIDAEINAAVQKISDPVLRASGVLNAKLHIIIEKSPNAFATYGNNIIITSGLIGLFPDPGVLRGVVAHEVGHIKAGHVLKMENKMQWANVLVASSILFSIAGVLGGATGDAILAPYLITNHISERSLFKHSRENEYVADTAAKSFLSKSGYDHNGLVELLKYFHINNNISGEVRYDLTHPLSMDRINNLHTSSKDHIGKKEDPGISFMYKMASAKLGAVTGIPSEYVKRDPDAARYFNIHNYQRSHRIQDALREIDVLIQKYPDYPYFLQKKAELLLSNGSKDAILYYKKAINLDNNRILKLEKSIAIIIISSSNQEIKEAIATLEIGAQDLKNNSTIINYLSLAYDKIGNKGMSIYYRALHELCLGKKERAKQLALTAKEYAGDNQSLRKKINDIINGDF